MKNIIEIKGVKFEVDLSKAKKIQEFKVGDKIRVLKEKYDVYKSYAGIIIGFYWFENLPTIRIVYLEESYAEVRIKFLDYNEKNKDIEISPVNENDLFIDKTFIIESFNRQIEQAEFELQKLKKEKELFLKMFGKYFEEVKNV